MSAPLIPSKALWLDPFRALKAAEQAQLGQAGVLALAVSTLDDLQASLKKRVTPLTTRQQWWFSGLAMMSVY
jgi:hypothetical protein